MPLFFKQPRSTQEKLTHVKQHVSISMLSVKSDFICDLNQNQIHLYLLKAKC